MTKPYTEADFSAQITDDRTWRLKEISDLKAAIHKADPGLRRVLLRSLVTICYAHWEGYIRFSARKYMEHIALRKLKYSELNPQFLRNHFLPRLGTLAITKTGIEERDQLLRAILDGGSQKYSRTNDDLVDTRSNLNTKILSEICLVCSLPDGYLLEKKTFIDMVLLKRRNAIAHGEDTFIRFEDVDDISSGTVEIMRRFGDALENQIALKYYRRVPHISLR